MGEVSLFSAPKRLCSLLPFSNWPFEKYLEEPGPFRIKYRPLGNFKLQFILKIS